MQRLFGLGRDLGVVFPDPAPLEQAMEHTTSEMSHSGCLPANEIDLLLTLTVEIVGDDDDFEKGREQVRANMGLTDGGLRGHHHQYHTFLTVPMFKMDINAEHNRLWCQEAAEDFELSVIDKIGCKDMVPVDMDEEDTSDPKGMLQKPLLKTSAVTGNVKNIWKCFAEEGMLRLIKLLQSWNDRSDVIATLSEGNDRQAALIMLQASEGGAYSLFAFSYLGIGETKSNLDNHRSVMQNISAAVNWRQYKKLCAETKARLDKAGATNKRGGSISEKTVSTAVLDKIFDRKTRKEQNAWTSQDESNLSEKQGKAHLIYSLVRRLGWIVVFLLDDTQINRYVKHVRASSYY